MLAIFYAHFVPFVNKNLTHGPKGANIINYRKLHRGKCAHLSPSFQTVIISRIRLRGEGFVI